MEREVLSVDSLTIRIPGYAPPLVDRVSLQIVAGERVALLGRSGSGKSLIAAAIAGTLSPRFTLKGTIAISAQAPAGAHSVALVQQDSSDALNPLVRVGAQLDMPMLRVASARAARERSRALVERVGLSDPDRILHSFPAELSGGQRQRICIALALACQAPLLIADEPTTALDVVTQAAVMDAFTEVQGDAAGLLFITHDLALVAETCARALIVDEGRLVEQASLDQLFGDPHHPVTRSLVAEARRRSSLVAA